MKRRWIALLLTALTVFSLVTGCAQPAQPTQSPEQPDAGSTEQGAAVPAGPSDETLVIGLTGEPTSLDMHQFCDGISAMAYIQLYDTLVYYNFETGELEPCLAESWERIDDLTMRFHLRDDVYFHDGDQFKASDVIYNIKRGKELGAKAYIWDPFDEVNSEVIDDFTVDIRSYEPFAAMVYYLAEDGASIVSEDAVEAVGIDAFKREPVGTGAYKFSEWVPGQYLIYERNDDYFNGTPYYKYMKFMFMSDSTSRTLALQSGDIDICPDPLVTSIADLESQGYGMARCNDMVSTNIVLNTQHEILSNKLVRKAMRWALDIPAIGDIAFSNTGTAADSFFPYYIPGRVDATGELAYGYDVEKAKALLAEAGYPDGFEINIWTNENPNRISICEMLQNAWGAIGITCNVTVMEHATMIEQYGQGLHDVVVNGFAASIPDGDVIHDWFYSTVGFSMNYSGYQNPEWDACMDEARVLMNDDEGRVALYEEAVNILRDDLPTISVRYSEAFIGYKPGLTGVVASPSKMPRYWWVTPE